MCFISFGICICVDKKYLDEAIKYFNNFDLEELFLLFAFLILHLLYNLCIYISIKRYNPNYVINLFIIEETIYSLKDIGNWYFYINIILTIIYIFIFLIYNEIIEINCCGLDKNTKRNIRKRAQTELEKNDNNERFESLIEIDGFVFELQNNGLNDVNNIDINNDTMRNSIVSINLLLLLKGYYIIFIYLFIYSKSRNNYNNIYYLIYYWLK